MDEKAKAEKAAAEEAVREGQSALASFARDFLKKADDHPILHMGCEVIRAKVQKRGVDVDEMFKQAPQVSSLWEMFVSKKL